MRTFIIVTLALCWPSFASADHLLVAADGTIVQAVPDGYTVDADGVLKTPAGGQAYPESGLRAVEVSSAVVTDYRTRASAIVTAEEDWEALVQAKIREMAIAALKTEGHEPPAKPKELKLKNGQVVENESVKPTEGHL